MVCQKNELIKRLNILGVKTCFNSIIYSDKKLKYIVVGDNPGEKEVELHKYFVGFSGQQLSEHFINYNLCYDFYQECIIYNKTFIHSKKTYELKIIKEKIGEKLFNETLVYCANEIAGKYKNINKPILIFGNSELGPDDLFAPFWRHLITCINDTEQIFVFKHPAHNNFIDHWNFISSIKENRTKSSLELLFLIGKINLKRIVDKYKNET